MLTRLPLAGRTRTEGRPQATKPKVEHDAFMTPESPNDIEKEEGVTCTGGNVNDLGLVVCQTSTSQTWATHTMTHIHCIPSPSNSRSLGGESIQLDRGSSAGDPSNVRGLALSAGSHELTRPSCRAYTGTMEADDTPEMTTLAHYG